MGEIGQTLAQEKSKKMQGEMKAAHIRQDLRDGDILVDQRI